MDDDPSLSHVCPAVSIGLGLLEQPNLSLVDIEQIIKQVRDITDVLAAEEREARLAKLDALITRAKERV